MGLISVDGEKNSKERKRDNEVSMTKVTIAIDFLNTYVPNFIFKIR